MGDFVARADPDDGYVYLTSKGGYGIPRDLSRLLQDPPYAGVYSNNIRGELRFEQRAARAAVDRLQREGHRVSTHTGPRTAREPDARSALECLVCGRPYPHNRVSDPEESCTAPMRGYGPHKLQLVGAHQVCGPSCHEAALKARRAANIELVLVRSVDDD